MFTKNRTNPGFVGPETYTIYEKECKIMDSKWSTKVNIYLKLGKKPQSCTFWEHARNHKPHKIKTDISQ